MSNNILLIGFMGVGKSSLARKLSKELKIVSIDTDKIIENMEGKKIKIIFKDSKESYFRELEKKVSFWLEESVSNTIISTGGGFCSVDNLNNIGKVIYLKSSYEGIMKRINKHPKAQKKLSKRPLLKDKKAAKELFVKRSKVYEEKANFIVNVESKNIGKIIKEIKIFLRG